ncbi:cytochrome b561 and DOMON domain-containing protein [Canna indica]|uniref:Cytochrome b561 and DOMON domain-containing protein n=1 Tax=Canna indica TaxID=4628 RepID=A0AAQ3KVS5_9LILI|nr:cytochrome b561 and DOMON domain-containing protein [Canna indica]
MAAPQSLLLLLSAVATFASAAGGCSSVTFSSNRVYAACSDLPQLSSSLHWSFDAASGNLSLAFVAPPPKPDGWVSWAINPTATGMIGSQALIAFRQPDGTMGVKTYSITGYGPVSEGPIAFPTSGLAAEFVDGAIRLYGNLKLPQGTTTVNQVWQVGATVASGVPQKHDFKPGNLGSKGTVDLVKATAVSPAPGAASSSIRNKNIHGILNAVSWGILLPTGQLFARYLKTFKSADPAWFYLHVACQVSGYIVGVAGWGTGLAFALFLRPKPDHKYRFYWNVYHHLVGYTVIVLGIINIFKGMEILAVDHQWKVAYTVVICILAAIALLLEIITWIIVIKRKRSDNSTSKA